MLRALMVRVRHVFAYQTRVFAKALRSSIAISLAQKLARSQYVNQAFSVTRMTCLVLQPAPIGVVFLTRFFARRRLYGSATLSARQPHW
jgi:hypothetical protein